MKSEGARPAGPPGLARRLAAINEALAALSRSLTLQEALDRALDAVAGFRPRNPSWILLRKEILDAGRPGPSFSLAAQHELPPALDPAEAEDWSGDCLCLEQSREGRLTGAGQRVACSRLERALGEAGEWQHHLSLPLRSGDRSWGLLNVALERGADFADDEVLLLENLAAQLGLLIDRFRLEGLLKAKLQSESAVLLEFSSQLLDRSTLADKMSFLSEALPALLGYHACAILLPDEEGERLSFCAASGWLQDPHQARLQIPATSSSLPGRAMQAQVPILVEDLAEHPPASGTDAWIEAERFRSLVLVPLLVEGRSIGCLLICHRHARVISEIGRHLLYLMANQAAIAIENARLHEEEIRRQRLEDELDVGHQIQLGLLPDCCPEAEGWDFARLYQPARQVGGDFYDFFELGGDPSQLGLVIADVVGKGVPAALFMALSRSLIRTKSMTGRSPADVLARANRLIYNDSRSNQMQYLTAFYGTLDLNNGSLSYANAGHNRPLLLRGDGGDVEELSSKGIIMGMFEQIELEEKELILAAGDSVLLYTDGVTEAMDEEGDLFGDERLRAVLAANAAADPEALAGAIGEELRRFTRDYPQSDDITLFIVKRLWAGA